MNNKVIVVLLIVFFVGLLIGMNFFMNKQIINMLSVEDVITTNDLNQSVNINENDNYTITENTISDESKIIHVSSSNFEIEVLNSDKPVLIDFYADWCEPCKIMSPIVEMIAEENENIKVVKVNVDNETDLASKYGAYSIPTFVVIKDGVETNRTVGITKKANLLKLIND